MKSMTFCLLRLSCTESICTHYTVTVTTCLPLPLPWLSLQALGRLPGGPQSGSGTPHTSSPPSSFVAPAILPLCSPLEARPPPPLMPSLLPPLLRHRGFSGRDGGGNSGRRCAGDLGCKRSGVGCRRGPGTFSRSSGGRRRGGSRRARHVSGQPHNKSKCSIPRGPAGPLSSPGLPPEPPPGPARGCGSRAAHPRHRVPRQPGPLPALPGTPRHAPTPALAPAPAAAGAGTGTGTAQEQEQEQGQGQGPGQG